MDFVLLHGTGQSTAGWALLTDALARRGHRTFVVDFPVDQPDLLAEDYARIAADQLDGATDEPVVLAHSGAGLLLPAVADTLHARHLVWLTAAIPDFVGKASFADEIRANGADIASDEWREFSNIAIDDPVAAAYFVYHDCDLATLRWALTTRRLFYPAAVYAAVPPPAPSVPSIAVVARHDRTLRPDWLRRTARERLGVAPIELDGGHAPHVSRPDELAGILVSHSVG